LVQLQADRKEVEAAGVQVVGVSYDPVKVLAGFAARRGIQFPLLSDPGSKTIEAYGVLNKAGKGVPHPGTFVIDKEGVVRAKLFLEGYRTRHSSADLIKAAKALP
jgi:peroxiredoxin Q/BCP